MSFSSQVKDELVNVEALSSCCMHAQVYGMLLFGRAFSSSSICLSTENENVANKYMEGICELTGITPDVINRGGRKLTVGLTGRSDCIAVREKFGHSEREVSLRINRANIADECCFAAFLRGAFLSCGIITSPEKNYHLEFVVPHFKLCNDFLKLMDEIDLSSKEVKRKNTYVLYLKDSETIEDVMTSMGAIGASLEIMGIKIHKDMRNNVNRKVNFETANISRAVDAAVTQMNAIRLIEAENGLDTLPAQLRETAALRMENPQATLRELGEMFSEPVSRSGVNHRLNKLIEIAKDL